MAGHSQFKNIMYRKGAQDAKRARIFTRLLREVSVAAREGGPEPAANPRLRSAIQAARTANVPRDNIERATRKGVSGEDGAQYEEVRYEGFGPGGAAIIVETLTDNRNRTASQVRTIFGKRGGSLGELNSVSFRFERLGRVVFDVAVADADTMFEQALEAGARDVTSGPDGHECLCPAEEFGSFREQLEQSLGESSEAGLIWQPLDWVEANAETARSVLVLIEALEDQDDVQSVTTNIGFPDPAPDG